MSWLARSLAIDDSAHGQDQPPVVEHVGKSEMDSAAREPQSDEFQDEDEEHFDDPSRGMKEDLTELKQTLSRQFWGVASFLAPPPPPPPPPPRLNMKGMDLDVDEVYSDGKCEILADEEDEKLNLDKGKSLPNGCEFGEETKISRIEDSASPNLDMAAAPAAAEEDEVWDVVGITEEVLTFGRNIGMHPETWLDYPIEEEDDPDEFVMTTDQREHTYAMEYLSPRLAALRIELCPAHMSEGYFWKVYFVLLHSRLEKQDAEILSTPQAGYGSQVTVDARTPKADKRASLLSQGYSLFNR